MKNTVTAFISLNFSFIALLEKFYLEMIVLCSVIIIIIIFHFLQTILSRNSSVMFRGSFNVDRLRVNLRLVINRLKLLEKKKSKLQLLVKKKKNASY